MSLRPRLELRHDDGTSTLYELDLTAPDVGAVELPATSPEQTAASPLEFRTDRYEIEAIVGRGGFADVVRAADRKLGRTVALKIPRRADAALREEAALAARLQHPNIVPVYDADDADGRPYYAMKLLSGLSLREVLAEVAAETAGVSERFGLPRLLEIFRQVCLAVEYAHDEGVLHRDIKPANIMVGAYGEVVLTDWGIARQRGEVETDEPGMLRGTLAYMAPELFNGEPQGSVLSDVYALGATLYEVLTHHAPRRGSMLEQLSSIRVGPPPAPSTLRPGIPPRLERICLRAMAPARADRYPTAAAIVADIGDYLDAERDATARARRAERTFVTARQTLDAYHRQRASSEDLAGAVDSLRLSIAEDAPTELRRVIWEGQASHEASRVAEEVAFGRAVRGFQEVLLDNPDHLLARAALSELYWSRLREAEAARDPVAAARFAQLVGEADARGATQLGAPTRVVVECDPMPTIELWEYRRLGPILERRRLSASAETRFMVPPGNYCLRLLADGHVSMWVPFVAQREPEFVVRRRLYGATSVAPGFVVVTGGELPDFAMGRHPLTVGEFLEFANDPDAGGAEVLPGGETSPYFERIEHTWSLRKVDADGDVWELAWPMLMLSRDLAVRYADWRARRTGFALTLPTKEQWEWAATGPDGRAFPWGDGVDPGCANLRVNIDARALPRAVGSFPTDESPFGVCDMGGGVSEWTLSEQGDSGVGILKGASFNSPIETSRITVNRFARPRETFVHYGMRLVQRL